jgi:threonine dehydratase
VVRVSEDEIAEAMRAIYAGTHNIAEGAGAAAFAALLKEKHAMRGKRVGVVLSGANIDTKQFAAILTGGTPSV